MNGLKEAAIEVDRKGTGGSCSVRQAPLSLRLQNKPAKLAA